MVHILKTITQKKLGLKIENYNSSKMLSEIIYTETGIEISYNTLRRFFGIVKPVKPSNYTLDTLAVFNGFKSYNDFVMNFHLKNRAYLQLFPPLNLDVSVFLQNINQVDYL